VAGVVVRKLLENRHKIPPFTILNVNIPFVERVKGIRVTRQGIRIYQDELDRQDTYVRIVGPQPTGRVEEEGSDLWAVNQGYASITPIHLDMTAHRFLADIAAWDITL
jgi:5'-nucleotidase